MDAIASSPREGFAHRLRLQTQWRDNDAFGHANNAVIHSWLDTAVLLYLREAAGFDPLRDPVINVALETSCRFLRSVSFPEEVEIALRTAHLGRTSVRYEIGIFTAAAPTPAVAAKVADVFVERATMRPTPIPDPIRAALAALLPERTTGA
jgi:acyl-CoA thioester hydrolase